MKLYIALVLLIALPLFILAYLVSPPSFERELLLEPRWVQGDLRENAVLSVGKPVLLVFDSEVLSVDERGRILLYETRDYFTQASEDRFVNASQVHDRLVVKNFYGDVLQTIEHSGFPHIHSDLVVFLSGDGLGIEIWDSAERVLYTRVFSSLVVSFDILGNSSEYIAVAGLLDGRVVRIGSNFFDREERVNEATLPVVYNAQLHRSANGNIYVISVESFEPSQLYIRQIDPQTGEYMRRQTALRLESDGGRQSAFRIRSFDSSSDLPRVYFARNNTVQIYKGRGRARETHRLRAELLNAWQRGSYDILAFKNPLDNPLDLDSPPAERAEREDETSILVIQGRNNAEILYSEYAGKREFALVDNILYVLQAGTLFSYYILGG